MYIDEKDVYALVGERGMSMVHCSQIDALPRADIEPRSEGEWIDQYNGKYANPIYVCSVCRKGTLLTPYINELNNMEMTQALSSFCPKCGAKMKGGAE
jgi:hypothetical protein